LHSLRITQAGNEELTLSNDEQRVPWKVEVKWSTSGRLSLRFGIEYAGWNVEHAVTAARFHRLLSTGCAITLRDYVTGQLFFETPEAVADSSEVSEGWEEVLRALVKIQTATGTAFTVPDRDIVAEEVMEILETAEKTETGRVSGPLRGSGSLDLHGDPQNALDTFESESSYSLRLTGTDHATVLGMDIDLGEVEHIITGARLSTAEAERLREQVAETPGEQDYRVTFEFAEPARFTSRYSRWPMRS
jgi:hypothetical protein